MRSAGTAPLRTEPDNSRNGGLCSDVSARNTVPDVVIPADHAPRVCDWPVRRDDALEGLDLGWPVPLLHRSHLTADPTQPNLRQVHLIHAELFAELDAQGFDVQPGELGENITARHLDLLALPCGVQLRIGPEAVVEVTGLRNPCAQINAFQPRLLNAVLGRDGNGEVVRRAGIMGMVVTGGRVMPGDGIMVRLPAEPHHALECV